MAQITQTVAQGILDGQGYTDNEVRQLAHFWLSARAPAESVLEDALNRLLEAATEIVETVECYDPDTLLALDEDPHPPSTINASSDNLKHAIVSIRAAMAANGGNK